MKTIEKIDHYFKLIESIDYNHREGGKYAYVKFLSITREVLVLLQPVKRIESQVRAIENINWVFNEYLTSRFSEQQRVVFDMKRRELRTIFESLKASLDELEVKKKDNSKFLDIHQLT
jgi:hypothetical protein